MCITQGQWCYDKHRLHIINQRHYFTGKGPYSRSYSFPSGHVWMGELDRKESWGPKNWCFWTVSWEFPWTARRYNQSILEEISSEYSLEGLMLKFQYFGHLMQRTDSLEKTLMLGKIEGRRRREQQRMRWLDGLTNSMDMGLSELQVGDGKGSLACCSSWGCRVGHNWATGLDWMMLGVAVGWVVLRENLDLELQHPNQ